MCINHMLKGAVCHLFDSVSIRYHNMFADIEKSCKVHIFFSAKNNATDSYLILKCVFCVRMSVLVLV